MSEQEQSELIAALRRTVDRLSKMDRDKMDIIKEMYDSSPQEIRSTFDSILSRVR